MINPDHDHLKYVALEYQDFVQQSDPSQKAALEETSLLNSIVFTDEPNLKVFCRDCKKEINKTTCILTNSSIYRCVGCFAKLELTELPYQVIKSLNFPLVQHNWKACHEVLFLSLLQKHGFNNWADISQQMEFYGAKFTADELQRHYYQCYLAGKEFLPNILNNENFLEREEQPSYLKIAINPSSVLTFPSSHREECLHPHYQHTDEFQLEMQQRVKRGSKKQKKEQSNLEFYNEKRKEFDIQYDSEAEFMLANLEFRDDDSEEEKRIKFLIIDLYNRRLEKRNQIKHFVIQHRLLDQNYQKEKHRHRSDLQKQAFEELKPIARFNTLQQHNELIQKVAFTKQLKSVIQGLRKFRKTHPSNFKSLEEFLSRWPEEGKSKWRNRSEKNIKIGKKMQELLQKRFNLNRKEFQSIVAKLAASGRKTVYKYKDIEAVMLEQSYE